MTKLMWFIAIGALLGAIGYGMAKVEV